MRPRVRTLLSETVRVLWPLRPGWGLRLWGVVLGWELSLGLGLGLVLVLGTTGCQPASNVGRSREEATVDAEDDRDPAPDGGAESPELGDRAPAALEAGATGGGEASSGGGEASGAGAGRVVPRPDRSDALFAREQIPHLRLTLPPGQERLLRENPRQYVRATLAEEGGDTLVDVGLKLKGAAGSYQELDAKPALTLNVDKFLKKQRFHDLEKFHLNNSVQDESYASEWLCQSLCADLGLPAARVTHARVWLNERDLGLYVLKEGFDERFLARHFQPATGNLYDGGFCQEIEVDLEKDGGRGPSDHSDLHRLVAACRAEDPGERRRLVEEILDVPAFRTFMAFELMVAHWDGYCSATNNYRVYFHPAEGRAHFLPHGMDQTFGDPNFPVFARHGGMVARAVRGDDEWNGAFRARVGELLPHFAADRLLERLRQLHARLRPELLAFQPDAVEGFDAQHRDWEGRLREREEALARQLTEPDPPPEPPGPPEPPVQELDPVEPLGLAGWRFVPDVGECRWDEVPWRAGPVEEAGVAVVQPGGEAGSEPGGEPAPPTVYSLAARGEGGCVGSWRLRIRVPAGRYRWEAWVRSEGVEVLEDDDRGPGAGVRISGATRTEGLTGTTGWTRQAFEFEAGPEGDEFALVAELRCRAGRAWFTQPVLRRLP